MIVVSALPSLNCHVFISGWRRNTADPVEVIFPNAIDTFGNHLNGIQIPQGPGAEDVFNWDDPEHSWGFFVFACPAQQKTGANCYGNVTVPGAVVSIPLIVRQRGQQDVNLTLTLQAVAGGSGGAVASPLRQVRLGNRFRVGDFINIEAGPVRSGPIRADWLSAIWSVESVAGTTFVRICSVWRPEICLHTENQRLEAGPVRPEWFSAMWSIEPTASARYVRIGNRWMSGQYLNTERGVLEVGPVGPDWLSAEWWILE